MQDTSASRSVVRAGSFVHVRPACTSRGVERWYVDFDKCLPFFNEHQGCAALLAACPWNLPGVAETLVTKMTALKARIEKR